MKHIVRISDGLGNQMFQYAFAYSLAKRTDTEVLLDPFFWGTSVRRYQLEEFCITNRKYLISKLKDYVLGFGPRNGRRFKNQYREWLIRKKFKLVTEKQIMHYDSDVEKQTEPCFFMGFWQTPKYFDEYYAEIKEQFARKTQISKEAEAILHLIKGKTSVSLHIRRTDYTEPEINGVIKMNFYQEAIRLMRNQLSNFQVFVFTDDKEFIKKEFDICDYTLVEGISDLDEFELMRQCDHHIVANSTFSWWAAYLSANKGGIVYAPCTKIWAGDFYPSEWNTLTV